MHANASNAAHQADEWRQGWTLILASTAGVGLAAIPTYTLGVFVKPLSADFGWTIGAIVLAQTIYSLITGFGSPLAGMLQDRVGARPLALTGCVILCLGVASLGLNGGSLPLFYASWAVMAAAVAITSPIIWQKAIVDRFDRQRGLAVSVALCGSNIAGGLTPLIAAALILDRGWQAAYLGLAAYMFLTAFPLAYLFFHDSHSLARRTREDGTAHRVTTAPQMGMSVRDTLHTREFWALSISFFFAGAGITGFIVHFVPMLVSQGVGTMLAASAVSVLNVAAICGRLAAGWLMDRVFAPYLGMVALTLPVIGAVALFLSPSYSTGLLAGALVGLSTGAEYNMISYLAVRYFGLRRFGSIAGYLNTAFTFGCTTGPIVAAWSAAERGNYDQAVLWLGGSFCLAALLLLLCRRYAEPLRDEVSPG